MWPRTDLIDRLGIEHPLLQAPMGGESTPEMAIAVGNAGGLGGLGCSYMSNDQLSDKVAQIHQGTSAPFNLNFLYINHLKKARKFMRTLASGSRLVREAQDALHSAAGTKA
jgi:NAD(P)H-dependent flavin oxidoreductase YrpB (nitropropane dioxygenase family)